jgi:hypothetical protein
MSIKPQRFQELHGLLGKVGVLFYRKDVRAIQIPMQFLHVTGKADRADPTAEF